MFAFYDFETTGISPAFDQPLQFAAILTDDDFNQVEIVNIRCRLVPHILPAPMALAITGVTPDMLDDPTLPTLFEFSQQVSDIIAKWVPATWIGYNTINFDENVMRQMFYQNLHPNLYQTQTDGNDRLDLMKIIHAVWELAPDILEWPRDEKGRVSFKLDRLAPANGFSEHDAHDALGDVKATIHLLSLIRDRANGVYTQCLENRDKKAVMRELELGNPMRLVERFGASPPRSYYGVFAGKNPNNPNSVGFLDLDACDPASIIMADDATIERAVSASPKVIRTIAVNKAVNLFPIEHPNPVHTAGAAIVNSSAGFQERVGRALANRYADRDEPEHVEERIYSSFFSNAVKQTLEEFQNADWNTCFELLAKVEDVRLTQLGRRVLLANAPHLFSSAFRAKAEQSIRSKWMSNDPDVPWTTKRDVEVQLDQLSENKIIEKLELDALREFYRERLA